MLFNSIEFFIFFVVVFSLYWLLSHRHQNILLLVANCIFYASWNWRFLFLLLLCKAVSYYAADRIYASNHQGTRRLWLWLGLGFNLGSLLFFKYCNFFLVNLYQLLHAVGIPYAGKTLDIILPMGISFFTFQAMSYTIDVYRRVVKPTGNFIDYMVYVSFFPNLVAGPIERATHLLPQVLKPRTWNTQEIKYGVYLIFLGLFQKMFVADNLAHIVNPVFASPSSYQGLEVLIAMYAFVIQIFCDFAGYSNIARGLGAMMGFKIMMNFNLPFWVTNVQEFWNRWHISLSQWVRDYLYFPLVGSLRKIKGNLRIYMALMISMTLLGLWHGAAWNFVVFGMYYGLLLCFYIVLRTRMGHWINPKSALWRGVWHWARVIFMFHITTLGMTLFRSSSLSQAWHVLSRLSAGPLHMPWDTLFKFLSFALPILILEFAELKTKDAFFIFTQMSWLWRTMLLAFMTYLLLGMGVMTSEEFIYFQF